MKYVDINKLQEIRKKATRAQSRFMYLQNLMSEIVSDIDKELNEKPK